MKTALKLWLFFISFNVMASTDEERKLLESWGVEENNEGLIIYQRAHRQSPTYWVSTPLPLANTIDYSVLPINLKPLIIYGQ